MAERDVIKSFLDELQASFYIDREVSGTHFSGKTLKIDAVIRPRDTTDWKNKNIAFGLEFKDTKNFDGIKSLTGWLAQCMDYANTKWNDYGYLHIFTCPSLVDEIPASILSNPMFLQNFMGQLGIGEIKRHKYYGLSIWLHGHHRIWSANYGVNCGKNYTLERKFGSR